MENIKVKLIVFEKNIIVIINDITFGKFLKYNKNEGIFNYYNHPEIGIIYWMYLKKWILI